MNDYVKLGLALGAVAAVVVGARYINRECQIKSLKFSMRKSQDNIDKMQEDFFDAYRNNMAQFEEIRQHHG